MSPRQQQGHTYARRSSAPRNQSQGTCTSGSSYPKHSCYSVVSGVLCQRALAQCYWIRVWQSNIGTNKKLVKDAISWASQENHNQEWDLGSPQICKHFKALEEKFAPWLPCSFSLVLHDEYLAITSPVPSHRVCWSGWEHLRCFNSRWF